VVVVLVVVVLLDVVRVEVVSPGFVVYVLVVVVVVVMVVVVAVVVVVVLVDGQSPRRSSIIAWDVVKPDKHMLCARLHPHSPSQITAHLRDLHGSIVVVVLVVVVDLVVVVSPTTVVKVVVELVAVAVVLVEVEVVEGQSPIWASISLCDVFSPVTHMSVSLSQPHSLSHVSEHLMELHGSSALVFDEAVCVEVDGVSIGVDVAVVVPAPPGVVTLHSKHFSGDCMFVRRHARWLAASSSVCLQSSSEAQPAPLLN